MKTIGIFLAGQQGDILSAASVLKYRNELWGDCKIIWYMEDRNRDLLKYQDVELRTFPRGFGYPEMCEEENAKLLKEGKEPEWEDWQPLIDENNHLNLELAKKYPSMNGIDLGFFPAPHQMGVKQRHGLTYPECSKKVFGVPMDYEWHPVLKFSNEENTYVSMFMNSLPKIKTVCIETMAGSGQSLLEDEEVVKMMDMCIEVLGDCNFIFVSHKYLRTQEYFPEHLLRRKNVFFAKYFTVRQCALIVQMADLLISVSSGISVASVAWGLRKTPIIQFCGSEVCSTKALSSGRRFELITHDDKILDDAYNEMNKKLTQLLTEIK